jgi:dTDP-4-dehydrorhamnose reductase
LRAAIRNPDQIDNLDTASPPLVDRSRVPERAIVVTGASGLLGSNLVVCAARQQRKVTAVSHRHGINLRGVDGYQLDLANAEAALAPMKHMQPGSIVHCAAATDVDWCEDHPQETVKINVEAPGWLAEFAFQRNVPFVYISTDAVFDGTGRCYAEVDEPNPTNVYARSKLQGEREVLRRNRDAIVARVALYGCSIPSPLAGVFPGSVTSISAPYSSTTYVM